MPNSDNGGLLIIEFNSFSTCCQSQFWDISKVYVAPATALLFVVVVESISTLIFVICLFIVSGNLPYIA